MFNFPMYPNPTIQKSNSSFGNYVIKINDVTFKFFMKKAQAAEFLKTHLVAINGKSS